VSKGKHDTQVKQVSKAGKEAETLRGIGRDACMHAVACQCKHLEHESCLQLYGQLQGREDP
jgi:hypothetical protein